ncbi:MAG TPA: PAS domain S-box protein [Verrucomicrobiae bacterium]|nr:PAS domain S-box protein [Verrucomicrobiae bacterium]
MAQRSLRGSIKPYLLAALCTAFAFVLRLGLDPIWKDRLPYVSFFIGFFVVAQFAAVWPCLFAMIGGFLLGDWFFVTPRHSLLIHDQVNQINAAFYFVFCSAVLFFSLRMRRALAAERAAGSTLGQLAAIVESSDDAIIRKSLTGKIVSWNSGAEKLYGYTETEMLGQSTELLLASEGGKELAPLLERVGRGEQISHFETTQRRKGGDLVEVSVTISPVRNGNGQIIAASTITRDIGQRKRAERERERLLSELQTALSEVKTLSGFFPICAHCKKIRDDKGYWNQIEVYVRDHSNASFTHGICPECARRNFDLLKSE